MGKIFISHSSANNAEALAIHDWLAEAGWGDVFLDLDPRRGLVAGDRWQAALKAAAESCELILILISPDWAKSKWCLAEFLLAKQMNKQILGVVVKATPLADLPVELTAEWQLVDLSAPDVGWTATISPPRHEPETVVSFSGTGLARLRSGLEKAGLDATTFNWPPADDPGRAPYRGLLPLEAEDAGIFFGRDGAIILTLDALRGLAAEAPPRFATILGASGAGKSSFLRAGLLPRLARDSQHFHVLPIIRPGRAALTGEHGFAAMLEAALRSRNITLNRADIRNAVNAGALGVAPLLRRLVDSADAGDVADGLRPVLVLAVDQAEELLSADNTEASAFLTLLAGLGATDDPKALVIFTVRSDSFDQLQSRPELASTQPHHLVDLPPVQAGSFGDIIRGPARRLSAAGRKLAVEETLVDALLSDIETGGAKDALPLLAFTLERLFIDYGADGDLQLSEYERLGRIRGAIEAAVDSALAKADGNPAIPRDRAARLALLRRGLIPWLAGIDPATGSPRRRVARLAEVPVEARPLIELMIEQRLLSTDVDRTTSERTVEPAHEALLRQWGALDGWLVEDSADLSLIEAVRRAATEWEASARGPEFLVHTGARLATAEQLANAEKFSAYLTSSDRAYLAAARTAENAVRARARSLRLGLGIAASAIGVVLVAGLTAGWFIWQAGEGAKREAAANFQVARSEAAMHAGRPEEAAQAALAAYDMLPSARTRTAALAAGMAISPHSLGVFPVTERIAGWSWVSDGRLDLWGKGLTTIDPRTRAVVPPDPAAAEPALGFAPIGMARRSDGTRVVFYLDVSITDEAGTVIAPPLDGIFALRAVPSADGMQVLFLAPGQPPLLRDCRSSPCKNSQLAGADNPKDAAFSPDGNALAVIQFDSKELLIYRRGEPVQRLARTFIVSGVAWGAGDILVVGDDIGASVLSAADPDSTGWPLPSDDSPGVMAVSPKGGIVATPCHRTNICLSGPFVDEHGYHTYGLVAELYGHREGITRLAWNADGTMLASMADDGTLRLWSSEPDRSIVSEWSTMGSSNVLWTLALDRARGTVVAGAGLSFFTWQGEGPPRQVTNSRGINDPGGGVRSLAFLADGRLATVYENQALAVWTLGKTDPDRFVPLDNLTFSRVAALTGDIRLAAPLSNKTTLVLSGDDLRESIVPADTTAPLDQWGIAAAPSANTVFVSYSDGSIRRRDLAAGTPGMVVYDASKPVCGEAAMTDNNGSLSLDVSADGKWLAATRVDDRVIVHNLADPARPLCFTLPARDSKTVAFSPDSTRLAVLSATDELYVFDLARPDDALIYGLPAVPENSVAAKSLTDPKARATHWLAWRDASTLAIATAGGTVEFVSLDPAAWRVRVDSLTLTQ